MEQAKIANEIALARKLIRDAQNVLLANEIARGHEYAPDLLPVVVHLLSEANCRHLYEAEQALFVNLGKQEE